VRAGLVAHGEVIVLFKASVAGLVATLRQAAIFAVVHAGVLLAIPHMVTVPLPLVVLGVPFHETVARLVATAPMLVLPVACALWIVAAL